MNTEMPEPRSVSFNNDNNVIGNEENVQRTIEPTEQQQQQQQDPPTKETKSLIEETTTVLEKLKEMTNASPVQQTSENERKIKGLERQVKNPFKNLTPRATQLIYWENPTHSGAVLAIGLVSLIYTAYYSLFNTFCALATILIGANWAYVIGRKQLQSLLNQKVVNPHEHLLVNQPWYIERNEADKYLDTTIEAVNFVLLEIQRVVLVDDPMRTIKYVLTFYVLWTLGGWFSFRTFFGLGLILGFVAPISYQKNKVLVDEKLDQANKFLHSHLGRGFDFAKQHTGGMYEKAKSFAAEKGLVGDNKGSNTKKEE